MVILVTGKQGAGKTTYAMRLAHEFMTNGRSVILLDSDRIRQLDGNRDFSDEGRKQHLERLAKAAQSAEQAGAFCIVAAIAPRREWRWMMRSYWRNCRFVYIPGGTMWPGTKYEEPTDDEF